MEPYFKAFAAARPPRPAARRRGPRSEARATSFESEAHRQSQAVAASALAREDQAFIDAVSDPVIQAAVPCRTLFVSRFHLRSGWKTE